MFRRRSNCGRQRPYGRFLGPLLQPLVSCGAEHEMDATECAMVDISRGNGPSLTGLWNGLFSYPRRYDPTQFVAILIQSGSSLSGTTHESCAIEGIFGGVLYATLQGQRDGS